MLAYRSGDLLLRRFSELLAADLDDDARLFYARMAADVAAVADSPGRAAQAAALVQNVLEALVAAPNLQPGCWRRLHRGVAALTAGLPDGPPALARLRAFLDENPDLAEPPCPGLAIAPFAAAGA
ncbi:MAG TPA: hypothetical protein VGN14_15035 [Candidatus Elarobacter sp.]